MSWKTLQAFSRTLDSLRLRAGYQKDEPLDHRVVFGEYDVQGVGGRAED
jgi:hypothetical protein